MGDTDSCASLRESRENSECMLKELGLEVLPCCLAGEIMLVGVGAGGSRPASEMILTLTTVSLLSMDNVDGYLPD